MKNIPITHRNKVYANVELNFTHDHSEVRVGSIIIDTEG